MCAQSILKIRYECNGKKRLSGATCRKQEKEKAKRKEKVRSKLWKTEKIFKPQVFERQSEIEIKSNFEETGESENKLLRYEVWRIPKLKLKIIDFSSLFQ